MKFCSCSFISFHCLTNVLLTWFSFISSICFPHIKSKIPSFILNSFKINFSIYIRRSWVLVIKCTGIVGRGKKKIPQWGWVLITLLESQCNILFCWLLPCLITFWIPRSWTVPHRASAHYVPWVCSPQQIGAFPAVSGGSLLLFWYIKCVCFAHWCLCFPHCLCFPIPWSTEDAAELSESW